MRLLSVSIASLSVRASKVAVVLKNLPANTGDVKRCGFNPCVGQIPWRGNGSPLQYSSLENPMDRGAWQDTVHGLAKSRTRQKRLSTHTPSVRAVTLKTFEPKASAAQRPRSSLRIPGELVEGGVWLPRSPKAVSWLPPCLGRKHQIWGFLS